MLGPIATPSIFHGYICSHKAPAVCTISSTAWCSRIAARFACCVRVSAVQAMCEVPSEVQQSKVFRQLPLHSNHHKAKAHSKGSLDFAIWLGPTSDELGRMDEGTQPCFQEYVFCFAPAPCTAQRSSANLFLFA